MFDVLIADDDAVSRRLLQVALTKAGYRVNATGTGSEALRVLESQNRPRLCVLDWMMPEMDGVDVCRAIRKRGREPYTYVILLTSKREQNEIVEGLESGADDYIVKPFDLPELKARLRAGVRILDLEEQLVSARELLRSQAVHDSLTGLLNRGAIFEFLNNEMARSLRSEEPLALIMIDLDHFKDINDTHGHQAGDAVLRDAAARIEATIRQYDAVGRYGGEEFLVVSPNCTTTDAINLAERLRTTIAAAPIVLGAKSIPLSVSLGVASTGDYPPSDRPTRPEELIHAADEALYAAKRNGRNRVETQPRVLQQ